MGFGDLAHQRQAEAMPFHILLTRGPLKAAGVRLDDAGIHGNALAHDKPRFHTLANNALKYLAQRVAVAEAAVPVDRKRRMVGNLVFEA